MAEELRNSRGRYKKIGDIIKQRSEDKNNVGNGKWLMIYWIAALDNRLRHAYVKICKYNMNIFQLIFKNESVTHIECY